MMNREDKDYAERLLQSLFIGSQLHGMDFGIGPETTLLRFLHAGPASDKPDILWINIESKWNVYSNEAWNNTTEIAHLSEEERYHLIIQLRREKIMYISLAEDTPHLIIEFKSGKTLFINGHDNLYECWQAGDEEGEWGIVAIPGDDIAYWEPEKGINI